MLKSPPWCMHAQFRNPTITLQAPLSIGFPRQEYWSRLPCPLPGDLPNPETESMSLVSLFWQVNFFFYHYTTWEAS